MSPQSQNHPQHPVPLRVTGGKLPDVMEVRGEVYLTRPGSRA